MPTSSTAVCSSVMYRQLVLLLYIALAVSLSQRVVFAAEGSSRPDVRIVDLSLLVSPEMPCTWPAAGFPPFHMNHYLRIGPTSAYNSDILVIDGNTRHATRRSAPFGSSSRHEASNAGPLGRDVHRQGARLAIQGQACVVDCRDLLESGSNGRSPLVTKDRVIAWERQHRPLATGDVVLFYSGYSDRFYQPLPAGRRFVADPVEGRSPAFPDPDPACMEYLATRGVMTLGTDSASMGPLPDLAEPTHLAGLKHGMIWTESATHLGELPATGAFYCMLAPKHADGAYSETRALAVVGERLAARLIESVRKKRVADLSVTFSTELPVTWPGAGSGNHRQPYLKVPLFFAPNLGIFHVTHMLDAHAGTHMVPPSYALPPAGFDNHDYPRDVQGWLADYERKYGARGTSDVTTEQVPLSQTCGWARVIDVKHRIGTTKAQSWPQPPEITVADIEQFEKDHGVLKPDEIVIFRSGYSDQYCRALPEGKACFVDPLNGEREGWPAPGPDAIVYLAKKGIRCVATDGPTLGGSEPRRALMTYWALASRGMVGVEYLTGVGNLTGEAYFMFAPINVRGCHGGPGRALAFY